MIYKKGSKGDEVKKIQKVVGCTADGIFGANTENAVKVQTMIVSANTSKIPHIP